MQKNKRRFYTPQFSGPASGSVRRYAWALGLPMTKVMRNLIAALPAIMDPKEVCPSCKDKSFCKVCNFGRSYTTEEKTALLSAIVSA